MIGRRWRSRPAPKPQGYEFHPDQYVTFSPAELAALELPAPAIPAEQSRIARLTPALRQTLEPQK